jgi:hypothetical protein
MPLPARQYPLAQPDRVALPVEHPVNDVLSDPLAGQLVPGWKSQTIHNLDIDAGGYVEVRRAERTRGWEPMNRTHARQAMPSLAVWEGSAYGVTGITP